MLLSRSTLPDAARRRLLRSLRLSSQLLPVELLSEPLETIPASPHAGIDDGFDGRPIESAQQMLGFDFGSTQMLQSFVDRSGSVLAVGIEAYPAEVSLSRIPALHEEVREHVSASAMRAVERELALRRVGAIRSDDDRFQVALTQALDRLEQREQPREQRPGLCVLRVRQETALNLDVPLLDAVDLARKRRVVEHLSVALCPAEVTAERLEMMDQQMRVIDDCGGGRLGMETAAQIELAAQSGQEFCPVRSGR